MNEKTILIILAAVTIFFTIPMIVVSAHNGSSKPSKEQLARDAKIERLSDALQQARDEDDNANGVVPEQFSYDQ
jgi:hypothetical protein